MLRYLQHSEIDPSRWDACLQEAPNGLIYGLSWYLNVVSPGWQAVVKEEGGKYVAVMPLPATSKFGFKILRQPLLTQQLGVFSLEPLSAAEWAEIATLIKARFRVVTRYAFNTGNPAVLAGKLPGFSCHEFATYHINLQQSYAEIFRGYKKSRKWRVNQAKGNKLRVEPAQNLETLFALFGQHTAGKLYGFVGEGYTYELLKALHAHTAGPGTGQLLQVVNERQEVVAMAFFTFFRKQIIYLFSTTTPAGKKMGAIPFLLDHMLEKYAGSGYIFDFEAPRPDGPGAQPVIDFYQSFGAEKITFPAVSSNHLPAPLRWLQTARMQLYRRWLNRRK